MGAYLGAFSGVPIVVSYNLQRFERYQFRFPRSKGRRIRKKWSRDSRNFREKLVGPESVMISGVLYCTPHFYENLKEITG
jgi:hypothetical protein